MDTIFDSDADYVLWAEFTHEPTRERRDGLVARYLSLARTMAAKLYVRRCDNTVPFADYLQYARVGLVEAVDSFDPGREVPFEAFSSYRIKGAILNGLASESELAAQRAFSWRRLRDRVDAPKPHELDGDRRSSLEELVHLTFSVIIAERDPDQDEVVDESIASNPYALAELSQLRRAVRALLPALPERERELIRRHYEEHIEFQRIAADWGVTKGRVSQIHSQALDRLRRMLRVQPACTLQPPQAQCRVADGSP